MNTPRADSAQTVPKSNACPSEGPSHTTKVTTELPNRVPAGPDASDVVTGPVGSASLRDPASSGLMGADLDRLPTIDVDAGESITPDESSTGLDSPSSL